MTSYQYKQLQDRQIRLLDLKAGEHGSRLKGTIRHVSIDDPLDYEALSYTWGDSGTRTCHSISCDNQHLGLTLNLNLALLRLRSEKCTRALWVDQICINQTNTSERNHQVRLMGDIYRKARQVDVWLGEEDDETAMGLELMPDLLATFPKASGDSDIDDEVPDIAGKLGLPVVRSSAWIAFAEIFTRPYFRRMWIVQEVALGSNVMVYCGSHAVKWDDLTKAGLCMRADSDDDEVQAHNAVQMIRAYRKLNEEYRKHPITDLMFYSYNLQCLDPRDKIYGMLGLVTESHDGVPTPDYNSSVQLLYGDFTRSILLRDRSLAFLCNVLHPQCLKGLPSWVSDWTAPATIRRSLGSRSAKHQFSAGGEKALIEFSADKQGLYLQGTVIGEVRKLGSILPQRTAELFISEWEELAQSVLPYHNGDDFPGVLWRTLIASDPKDSNQSSDVLQSLYESWNWNIIGNMLQHKSKKHVQFKEFKAPPWWHPNLPSDDVQSKSLEFQSMIADSSLGRRMFTTDNRYLGLAPAVARERDLLCVLHGGPVPFILRQDPSSNQYTLVGECFALGLMHGEGLEPDRFPTQRFKLR